MSNDQPLQPHHGEIQHHDATPATPTEAFLEQNFRKIVILAVVVIAVVTVAGMIRYKTHQTDLAAAEQFSSAKTVEDCDLVMQKYPGSGPAGNAMLLKADLLWKANKKDSAVSVLKDFTKSFPKHPFFLSGLMGLASKQESIGDKAEAKTVYERLTGEFGKSEFAPLAQVRLGDMLWVDGKEEEAKKLFESLPSRYPGELSVSMSQNRLDLIAAGLPTKEVDGPPKPKEDDKAPDPKAGANPIQMTPGGVTPIKLDAGVGPKGTISPIATVPAPSTPLPSTAVKVDTAPLVPSPTAPTAVKMIESGTVAPSPTNPAVAPSIKLGPPVQQPPPPAGAPTVKPTDSFTPPVPPAPVTPPPPVPAPPSPAGGEAKK